MELPSHIEQKSEKWFFNTKTKRYIHADYIDGYLKQFYDHILPAAQTAGKYRNSFKSAKRRWDDES